MPTVSVGKENLFKALGKSYTDKEFEDLCFEFGVELDDITSERLMAQKEKGDALADSEIAQLSDEIIYKIDVPANRYDLLCLEGIARALRIFLGKEEHPTYKVNTPADDKIERLVVKPDTSKIRPFVVAAILRDVTFDEVSYKSFVDLQEKLHQNICRKRTLVAIGTHDYDTIEGPFTYNAEKPEDIKFVPLKEEREFDARSLFHYYKEEKKQNNLKQYLHIIEDSSVYPVIRDKNGVVLSLPPIINGEHSKIKLSTKNVFIECTATDYTKANVVLNTVVAMFSQYCKNKFSVESVRVEYEAKSETLILPEMKDVEFTANPDYINKGLGINLEPAKMADLLKRMQLPSVYDAKEDVLRVTAPPTRSDILHACDIQEDVAIIYGYDNIVRTLPKTSTVGKQQPLNQLSDKIRNNMAQAGYTETLTFVLCSKDENFVKLRRPEEEKRAVILSNPVSELFDVARTSLLPGVLNTVKSNRGLVNLPVRVFEVGDVLLLDAENEVGARNERRLCALYGGLTSGFEIIHGLVDRIMELNGITFEHDVPSGADKPKNTYSIEPSADESFFPGRRADILVNGTKVGVFGVFHPEVLGAFGISHPCSAVELSIEAFL